MTGSTGAECDDKSSIDDLFQRLPPLDSEEYVEFVATAPRAKLPPEVLSRAFRQLPPDSYAARATIDRLLRRTGTTWEYLQPLFRFSRQRAREMLDANCGAAADIHQDLMQDAVLRIIRVLPTARGAYAEVAWNAFSLTQFKDAWRERYGRRAEKLDSRGYLGKADDDSDDDEDPFDAISNEESLWPAIAADDQSARIERIAERVASAMDDPFASAVARATWFSEERPKTSGSAKGDQPTTLQERFADKSRDQINRALRKADRLLAAELLEDHNLTWSDDLRAMLEKQRKRGPRS